MFLTHIPNVKHASEYAHRRCVYFLIWGASTEQNVCSLTNFLSISIPLHSKCLRAIELTFSIFTRQHSEQSYVGQQEEVCCIRKDFLAGSSTSSTTLNIHICNVTSRVTRIFHICNSHYMTDQNNIFEQNSIFSNRCRMSVALNAIETVDIELTYFENDDENATQK